MAFSVRQNPTRLTTSLYDLRYAGQSPMGKTRFRPHVGRTRFLPPVESSPPGHAVAISAPSERSRIKSLRRKLLRFLGARNQSAIRSRWREGDRTEGRFREWRSRTQDPSASAAWPPALDPMILPEDTERYSYELTVILSSVSFSPLLSEPRVRLGSTVDHFGTIVRPPSPRYEAVSIRVAEARTNDRILTKDRIGIAVSMDKRPKTVDSGMESFYTGLGSARFEESPSGLAGGEGDIANHPSAKLSGPPSLITTPSLMSFTSPISIATLKLSAQSWAKTPPLWQHELGAGGRPQGVSNNLPG